MRTVIRNNPNTGKRERVEIPFTPQEAADNVAARSQHSTEQARERALARVAAYELMRSQMDLPNIEGEEDLRLLYLIFDALGPSARSARLNRVKGLRDYANSVRVSIENMDEATADAYDPATDPGCPSQMPEHLSITHLVGGVWTLVTGLVAALYHRLRGDHNDAIERVERLEEQSAVKEDITEIKDLIRTNTSQTEQMRKEARESVIRVHARVDRIHEEVTVLTGKVASANAKADAALSGAICAPAPAHRK